VHSGSEPNVRAEEGQAIELVTYEIHGKLKDHEPIVVAPIGDIQWSGERGPTAKDALRRHIDRCLEMDAYYIGMGDYTDFMSPSNRQRLKGAALYETAEDVIDDKALELTWEVYEKFLKPTKGRWLGLLEGHHFSQLKTGETTDQRLCQMLDARFLGTSAYIRLQFRQSANLKGNVVLWAHHGCGGGSTSGAPLNKLEKAFARWEGADIFLMGHTTKGPADRIPRPYPRWHGHGAPDLIHRDVLLVNTGGFSKAYVVNSREGRTPRGGYAERGMMQPSSIGSPIVLIRPARSYKGAGRSQSRSFRNNGEWSPEIRVEV